MRNGYLNVFQCATKSLNLVIILISSLAFFTGCVSDNAAREFGLAFSAPIFYIRGLAALDLLYCSESFRNKTERWPKDYAELSLFVQQSNGYLQLGGYERVELAQLPGDVLQISFVPRGSTNEMKVRLDARSQKRILSH